MTEDQFWTARPTDLAGVQKLLDQLFVDGQDARQETKGKAPRTSDVLFEGWRRRRRIILKWAQAVMQRIEAERADSLSWRLTSVGRHWETVHYFEAEMSLLDRLIIDLRQWVDEAALLGAAETSWLLEAGRPFSAWQSVREVLTQAAKEVWVTDPYVDLATLTLLLSVPGPVGLRILSETNQVAKYVSAPDWSKWRAQRGGSDELRVLPGPDLSHDRFLGIDDRVFMSGASFKDLGKRTSIIVEIESASVSTATRTAFETQWSNATTAP